MTTLRLYLNLILAVTLATPGLIAAQQTVSSSKRILPGSTDIGQTQKGSTVYDPASGSYQLTGGGADMWGSADSFHFTWVKLSGDAALTADVHFPATGVAPIEKAVLVIRQSLDPGAAYADVAIHGDGHITLQFRAASGGKTADITAAEHGSTRLRIERKGDLFTASSGSGDGKLTSFASTTVALEGPVYVGIGVCAHNADGLATVSFSYVTIEKPSHSAAKMQ
jgi:hypothetical protein